RIRIGAEVTDVGNPLLLVDDEIVDDVQVLGAHLPSQCVRTGLIVPTVIHVHVQVGADKTPERRRKIIGLKHDREALISAGHDLHRLLPGQGAEAALDPDSGIARWEVDDTARLAMEIMSFARLERPVEAVVSVHPAKNRIPRPAVTSEYRYARPNWFALGIDNVD